MAIEGILTTISSQLAEVFAEIGPGGLVGIAGVLVASLLSLGLCWAGVRSLRRARALERHLLGVEQASERAADQLMKRFGDAAALQQDHLEAVREAVGRKLERVERGIGEMRSVAADVSDLRRVLGNVKTRGVFGETQLGALLAEFLTSDRYEREFQPRATRGERVDFAVRLRPATAGGAPVYLPIDAKFPQDDYVRLLDARASGDGAGAERAARALRRCVRREATRIAEKYIDPPHTTDFAILFLPSESLHAEVLAIADLAGQLHRESRILLAGPATLAAILGALQIGFQMQTLDGRANELWRVLAAMREEFARFGEQTDRVRRKLHEAGRGLDDLEVRARDLDQRLSALAAGAAPSGPAARAQADLP